MRHSAEVRVLEVPATNRSPHDGSCPASNWKFVKTIGIGIVESQGRYLVGVRHADQVLAGMSEFPGGKCEPDESPQDCVIRECREETGLDVEPVELLQIKRFDYAHGSVELHFWKCRLLAENQQPRAPFRWTSVEELAVLPFPEANAEVVRMIQNPAASEVRCQNND